MALELINFTHFFQEVRSKISLEMVRSLRPTETLFFKCGSGYVALSDNYQTVHVQIAIGKGFNPFEIIDFAKKRGYKEIRFLTSENNKRVQVIGAKFGAELISTKPKFYEDGSSALEFSIPVS